MILFDITTSDQLLFNNPATLSMELIIDLHHFIMFYLILIAISVFYILGCVAFRFMYVIQLGSDLLSLRCRATTVFKHFIAEHFPVYYIKLRQDSFIEFIWTLLPCFILISIAMPSFSLLYLLDFMDSFYLNNGLGGLSIKVIAHQWYWSYEYDAPLLFNPKEPFVRVLEDMGNFLTPQRVAHDLWFSGFCEYDSYLVSESDLVLGDLRLLETDLPLSIPTHIPTRIFVTSTDVLHSWSVPSLGVKMDAVPGRLNETQLYITRPGIYYGQCSEICGVNHGFMPIKIVSESQINSDLIMFAQLPTDFENLYIFNKSSKN